MPVTIQNAFPSPEEEAAWRLGSAEYGIWEVSRRLKTGGYNYSFALVKKHGGKWHLVKRLGSTGGAMNGRTPYYHLEGLRVVRDRQPRFPPKLPPPATPERIEAAKVKDRAARLAGTERALRTWRRKLALATTKIKQYERRLRALERAAGGAAA